VSERSVVTQTDKLREKTEFIVIYLMSEKFIIKLGLSWVELSKSQKFIKELVQQTYFNLKQLQHKMNKKQSFSYFQIRQQQDEN
jgi:hypothetical protein